MLEPDEIGRWTRLARALGRKADDAAGLAQVLALVDQFEHEAMRAVDRLHRQGFSYGELARDLGCSKQAIRQRHTRWLDRQPSDPDDGDTGQPARRPSPPPGLRPGGLLMAGATA